MPVEVYEVMAFGIGAAIVRPLSISTCSSCWALSSIVAGRVVVVKVSKPSGDELRANILGVGGGFVL